MNTEAMSTERIWELLSAKLKSFLIARVTDEQAAEDLLQETFVRIHEGLPRLDDQQRINAWVFQIARNLVVDHYRAKRRPSAPIAGEHEAPEDEESNLNNQVTGWLLGMIARLPDGYREAVTDVIKAKVEGREVVEPPQVETGKVINLMDALKNSLEQAQEPGTSDRKELRATGTESG